MDLLNFRLIRDPRVAETDVAGVAEVHGANTEPQLTGLLNTVAAPLGMAEMSTVADGSGALARARLIAADALTTLENPIAASGPPGPPIIAPGYFAAVNATDRWLAVRQDHPDMAEFLGFRRTIVAGPPPIDLAKGRLQLCDYIVAAYVGNAKTWVLARLARFLLISDVLDAGIVADGALAAADGADVLWSFLHRRTVVLPPPYARVREHPLPLIRPPKVSDLFVVRQEWMCYRAGEVASIANVLAHSSHHHRDLESREAVTTTTTVTDQTTSVEHSQEDHTQTELSTEVNRASSIQAHIEGGITVSGDWGFTKYVATAQAGLSASLEESVRQASKVSRETISRAVSKVETHVRQERSEQIRTRRESISRYVLDNSASDQHVNGVYRWVDRIDRYQVFRFPDRLLLEFEFPEPGEYLRFRLARPKDPTPWSIQQPPPFTITADALTETTYARIAANFHATNVPAPPVASLSVTQAVAGDDPKSTEPTSATALYEAPIIAKTVDLTIPAGYLAVKVDVSGSAMPFRAPWRMEFDQTKGVDKKQWVEGFHHITFTAFAGGHQLIRDQGGFSRAPFGGPGPVLDAGATVQFETLIIPPAWIPDGVLTGSDNGVLGGSDLRATVSYQQAQLRFPRDSNENTSLSITPGAKDTVTVGILVAGAHQAAATFLVTCERSDSALKEWQQSAYDAIYAAWADWDQSWRNSQTPMDPSAPSGPWNSTSPTRNAAMIQEELKRQVISWLMGNPAFDGVNAVVPRPGSWAYPDPGGTLATAPNILFMEQAFDWGNLMYVCYPYYWARGATWDSLEQIDSADPAFAEFLRAGSVRVVVSARPGFEDAVNYWLLYGEPFLGGPLPVPGDPMYVSIATEIRDLKGNAGTGEPGECWESKMATPLLWLDPGPGLPTNAANPLGAPLHPLCT